MEVLSRARFLEFEAAAQFHYRMGNTEPAAEQQGQPGQRYLTSADAFAQGVVLRHPRAFRVHGAPAGIPVAPPSAWAAKAAGARRVLFILPAAALGENVGMILFMAAYRERHGPERLAVACAQGSADLYARCGIEAFALFLPRAELARFDLVVDLNMVAARRTIDLAPVDMEAELLAAFDLPPAASFPAEPRPIRRPRAPVLGLLPLASSPLRTLPPRAVAALAQALATRGQVRLFLNRTQKQSEALWQRLGADLPQRVERVDDLPTIGRLMAAVDDLDYAVLADSGPAHMTKLVGLPGLAVYSSAGAAVLQGRFTNLKAWQVPFAGPWCTAPCGLARVRRSRAGDVGCMGSLELPLADLPDVPRQADAAALARLADRPVPCIAALDAAPGDLVAAVLSDLDRHLARA
ncbi:glycosyltransferase family 9 protein [Zavarzinia sp. CC-PAN008]|uniref:glycosyltransferase family 9 protein n=1 Tax=Zavarzinia sp. CC-PAN008 TaxID=3243332 RepID=UPI003F744420